MSGAESACVLPVAPIDLDVQLEQWQPERAEKRDAVVRVVEYSQYPRRRRDHSREVGFTRDQSHRGMCILTKTRERVGSLLRVAVRRLDGDAALDALASVVWCEGRSDGQYWIGLALSEVVSKTALDSQGEQAPLPERDLERRPMLKVRSGATRGGEKLRA